MCEDFDQFSESYGREMHRVIAFSGVEHGYFIDVKVRNLLRIALRQLGQLGNIRVLDVGCGIGLVAERLVPHVRSVSGVDISQKSVEQARKNCPSMRVEAYDGREIPHDGNAFDVVVAINVFHHIVPGDRLSMLEEMRRVVCDGGIIMIFEHNPLNPLTVKVVRSCAFDEGVILLRARETEQLMRSAGLKHVHSEYILFTTSDGAICNYIERYLSWLPLGAQYVTCGKKNG
jgi:ubiquinone/menaquinone biosynthesis C-methylase UbiE